MSIFDFFKSEKPKFLDDVEKEIYKGLSSQIRQLSVDFSSKPNYEEDIVRRTDDVWSMAVEVAESQDVRGVYGVGSRIVDAYKVSGNETISKKLSRGVTLDDIKKWWDQPFILNWAEDYIVAAMVCFPIIAAFERSGSSKQEAIKHIQKTIVTYRPMGVEWPWSSENDLDPELRHRVENWRNGLTSAEYQKLVSESSVPINVMVASCI